MKTGYFIICWLIGMAGNAQQQRFRTDTSSFAISSDAAETLWSALQNGRLKAIDAVSAEPVPVAKISTWKMPSDTMATIDTSTGNMVYKIMQTTRSPAQVERILACQDWYVNPQGRITSRVRWIELLVRVTDAIGQFRGWQSLFRINYND